MFISPYTYKVVPEDRRHQQVGRLMDSLILPIPRLALSQAHLAQPIPTLGSRQYVIDKTGRTSHQIQHEQELFWYRQSLLSMLRLTYVEPGTKREGEVGLRRVTLEQLDTNNVGALKVEELEVRLWYESEDGGEAREGEFGRICCAVVNRLGESDRLPSKISRGLAHWIADCPVLLRAMWARERRLDDVE